MQRLIKDKTSKHQASKSETSNPLPFLITLTAPPHLKAKHLSASAIEKSKAALATPLPLLTIPYNTLQPLSILHHAKKANQLSVSAVKEKSKRLSELCILFLCVLRVNHFTTLSIPYKPLQHLTNLYNTLQSFPPIYLKKAKYLFFILFYQTKKHYFCRRNI